MKFTFARLKNQLDADAPRARPVPCPLVGEG